MKTCTPKIRLCRNEMVKSEFVSQLGNHIQSTLRRFLRDKKLFIVNIHNINRYPGKFPHNTV